MEIILKEDVYNLGRAGQVVKVRDGYARNFLLPTDKAVIANLKNKKEIEHHQKVIERRVGRLLKTAADLKVQLDQHVASFEKEAGAEDKLFGSVTNVEIAENLKQAGFSIDKRSIHIDVPIKTLGDHTATVRLAHEVIATIQVRVSKKQ